MIHTASARIGTMNWPQSPGAAKIGANRNGAIRATVVSLRGRSLGCELVVVHARRERAAHLGIGLDVLEPIEIHDAEIAFVDGIRDRERHVGFGRHYLRAI